MTRLIDDLLSLSRIEMRAHLPPETPIDLVPLVGQMVDTLSPLVRERGMIYQFALAPYPNWQKLAWAGALVITLSILVLSVVARLVLKKDTAR